MAPQELAPSAQGRSGQYLQPGLQMLDAMPVIRPILLLVGLAAAVAVGISIALWSQDEGYAVLNAGLTDREAMEVMQALESAGIDHRYETGSGTFLVPSGSLHTARLQLAAQDISVGSGIGFEMFNERRGLTDSQFMESARYQRALEVELQRTIASIRAVSSARVHLAMPKNTVFIRDRRPAGASVLVNLAPGRRLEAAQVEAIVNLVAYSVPEMDRAQVTVVDQFGNQLSGGENGAPNGFGDALERERLLEERLANRIEDLLVPIVGPGRVHARVAVDLDSSIREETEERYDPDGQVVRSEQLSEEPAGLGLARGIPGALSNQPPVTPLDEAGLTTPEMNPEAVPFASRSLRNFEIGRTIRHTQTPVGGVRRLSAAVILDEARSLNEEGEAVSIPYSEEQIERFTALVREALGFDAARGDSVRVVGVPFVELQASPDSESETPTFLDRIDLMGVGRMLGGIILLMLLILAVVRPLMQQLSSSMLPSQRALPQLPQQYLAEMLTEPNAASGESVSQEREAENPKVAYEERIQAAKSVVGQDPKRVAQVVKQWVTEDG